MFKILIVDDSHIYRRILTDTLHYKFPDVDISEASDGVEALHKITLFPPDLIFMDIRLPDESGLELTRRIKTQYPSTTIIILTSYDLPEYREAATHYKANHFLTKGLANRDQIVKLVESILSGRDIVQNGLIPESPI
jgi:YesN/AraC family two-component response regulator